MRIYANQARRRSEGQQAHLRTARRAEKWPQLLCLKPCLPGANGSARSWCHDSDKQVRLGCRQLLVKFERIVDASSQRSAPWVSPKVTTCHEGPADAVGTVVPQAPFCIGRIWIQCEPRY